MASQRKKNPWGLPKISLEREAAEFYVLEFLVGVEEYKPARPALNKKVKLLARAFSSYLPKAIHSELGCYSEIRNRRLLTTARRKMLNMRSEDWRSYYFRYPRRVSKMAFDIFHKYDWDCGYGGRSWAIIARTLMDYNYGRLKPKLFVDRTWSLRHNNDTVFDKEWEGFFLDIGNLGYVLRFQSEGNISELYARCGDSTKGLYRKYLRWKGIRENRAKRAH